MINFAAAYAATALVLLVVDLVWLGVVAKGLYRRGIGHLMAEQPNLAAAALFYVIFVAGLMAFAVLPHAATPGWKRTALSAALFGFVAYATYDLTNLATLKNWPAGLVAIDMAWGTLVSVLSAVAGKLVLDRMTAH